MTEYQRQNRELERSHSVASSNASADEPEKTFQTVIKQLLQTTVFIGCYRERRFVELLNDYRDVIEVSNDEHKLKETLTTVLHRIHKQYNMKGLFWIGITESSAEDRFRTRSSNNYCLYVELPTTPLGYYWCQIKTVKFRYNEILCRVKLLREVPSEDLQTRRFSSISNSPNVSTISNQSDEISITDTVPSIDWSLYFTSLKHSTNEKLYIFFTEWLTLQNIGMVLQFLVFLIASVVTGLFHIIPHVGEYSLKFMREFTYFVHAATPIFLGVLDMISKIFGGLYILIAMMWRGSQTPSRPPAQQIRGQAAGYRPPLKYY